MKKEILLAAILTLLAVPIVYADAVTISANVPASMSAVFHYSAISYGNLTAGSSDNAAPNQLTGIYNVTVTTNANWKVQASGTNFDDGSGHTFNVGNLTMDTNAAAGSLSVGSSVALTTGTEDIDTGYSPVTSTANYHGFWMSIPSNQYAASYSSTVTVTYANV